MAAAVAARAQVVIAPPVQAVALFSFERASLVGWESLPRTDKQQLRLPVTTTPLDQAGVVVAPS